MLISIWQNQETIIPPEQSKSVILSNQVLSGSSRYALKNEYGMVLIQQYESKDFNIINGLLECKKACSLFLGSPPNGFHIITSLKSTLKFKNGQSRQNIQPGFFGFLQNGTTASELMIRKNESQSFISIHLNDALLKQWMATTNIKTVERPQKMSNRFSEIIQSLVNAPYLPHQLHFFYDNKIREILFEIITREHRSEMHDSISSVENNIIHMLDHTMRYNPSEHQSLQKMSLSTGLSIFKLKTGFKENFGMGIFERLTHWRIQTASKLLRETNKPVKEIASIAGYKRLTSFITMYRKRTGLTPGDYRNAAERDLSTN